MPANLTPQYSKAEEEFRRAQSAEEQAICLEKMLQLIPKHKGTEKLQADLKTKLKEVRAEAQTEKSAKKVSKSYRVPRQGSGTVVIIGAPNGGKSRIIKELTKAEPEVAPYPFTTREPFPAMMPFEDVLVQLIDTPPVTDSQFEPYIVSYVRTADLVLLVFDGSSDAAPEETATVISQLSSRKTLLAESTGFDDDDFSKLKVKTLLVVTHASDADHELRLDFLRELAPLALPIVPVELDDRSSCETLRSQIYAALGVIRVYTKAPGKPASYDAPYTIPAGGTVEDLAEKVHRDLADKLKYAKVWGSGVHDGQSVGREHVLSDRDLVELHS